MCALFFIEIFFLGGKSYGQKTLSLLLTHEIDNYGPGSGHSQGQRPIDIHDAVCPWGCSVQIMALKFIDKYWVPQKLPQSIL